LNTIERVRAAPAPETAARDLAWPAVAALAAALVRLPFLTRPLSPDEGGYLLVASQWSPGRSLYGAYFVDRPPLLVGLYGLADELGGAVTLRLLGIIVVVAAVLLAARLGGTPAAVLCAALASTPLFDGMEIDGELMAMPFVLAAFVLLVRSVRGRTDADRYAAAAAAGALAAAAALLKQDIVDGLVVAGVLLLGLAVQRRWGEALTRAVAFAAGGVGTVAIALLYADLRGTHPLALWDALATFRIEAGSVIQASAAVTTPERLHSLLAAGLLAGVPLVVAAALLGRRRPVREPMLLWAGIAALVWETAGALLGGSYWGHYLLALVPGLVLLVAACGGSWVRLAVGYAATCSSLVLALGVTHPTEMGPDLEVAAYIHQSSRPGDTMVVAFGHPDIVREAGLQSPYQHLWSLSARVRDPHLAELGGLLRSTAAPRWVVVGGESLATWGIDASDTQMVLDARYREVTSDGDWHVFERR
jgi:hypothetical protein